MKDDFRLVSAAQIARLLDELDREVPGKLTPCRSMTQDKPARAVATVHGELIHIHPFRQRNVLIAWFVVDVMASKADRGRFDHFAWDKGKQAYIHAIHARMACSYEPMERLVIRASGAGKGSART